VVAPDPVASEAIALSCTAAMAVVEDPEPVAVAARVTVVAAARAAVDSPAPAAAAARVTVVAAAIAVVEVAAPVAVAASETSAAAAIAVVEVAAPVAAAASDTVVPAAARKTTCQDAQSRPPEAVIERLVAIVVPVSRSCIIPMVPWPPVPESCASIEKPVGDGFVNVVSLAHPTNPTWIRFPLPVGAVGFSQVTLPLPV